MATYKVVFHINHVTAKLRESGWSESVYRQNASDLKSQIAPAIALGDKRRLLLGQTADVIGITVVDVATPGRGVTYGRVGPGTTGFLTDTPQQALLIKLYSEKPNNRELSLRGVPDAQIVSGDYQPTPGYAPLVADYLAMLTNGDWYFPGVDTLLPRSRVLSVINQTVTVDGVVSYPYGTPVEFYRTYDQYRNLMRGPQLVGDTVTSHVFKLLTINPTTVITSGFIRQIGRTIAKINGFDGLIRIHNHKVGRPFGLVRGRAVRRA